MKIGLLTVPFNNNYGGFLQAFALKTILQNVGHEVEIINRRRNRSHKLKDRINRMLTSVHLKKDKVKDISIYTDKFKEKHLSPITEAYYTRAELRTKTKKSGYDCYIVGSDQVWRYKYAKDSIDDYFFGFIDDASVKRFSYAASFGIDYNDYPSDKQNKCAKLLQNFSGISVREGSAVGILSEHFSVPADKVSVVLDPTLLLPQECYCKLFSDKYYPSPSQYIFTYILDATQEKSWLINRVREYYDCEVLSLKAQTGRLEALQPLASVEEWLSKIYYSKFVVTDSFHGTVFSIIFNKPFIVYGNSNRGKTRFSSLLAMFGLESRYVESVDDVSESVMFQNIDWGRVNDIINIKKSESLQYLYSILNV